jgi:hypothetical protein
MNIDATTSTASVDAAIIYLASRDALDKLATPTPVLYGNVVMMPVIGKRLATCPYSVSRIRVARCSYGMNTQNK